MMNFLQQQGVLILFALVMAGGIFGQVMASRRYRKLCRGIQSLAALTSGHTAPRTASHAAPQAAPQAMPTVQEPQPQVIQEVAASRDQKLEESSKPRRKLSPQEEQIIADILKEYLS